MRVLNVVFDNAYGGPQRRIMSVGAVLIEHGIETVLCVPAGEGNAIDIIREVGFPLRTVRVSRIPNPRNLRRVAQWAAAAPRDLIRFVRLFRAERPEIVHVNGAFFFLPAIAARMLRIPLVWHVNDTLLSRRYARVLGRVVSMLADRVVVASSAVAKHYGLADSPHEVLYAPVDVQRFRPRRGNDRVDGLWRVGLVANWNRAKGQQYFVRAVALANHQLGGRLRAIMAGAKPATQSEHVRRVEALIAELGLDAVLEDRGFVRDVDRLIADLDLLVLSSTSEACPMSVLEAMACGIPVVATDVAGARELLLGDPAMPCGIVVSARSARELADAIVELARDPRRARMLGRNGRQRACDLFSTEACVESHRQVYLHLLSAVPGPTPAPP